MSKVRLLLVGPALVAAASLLLLAGCSALPVFPQSASQLAEGAFQSWEHGSAFKFKGSLSVNEGTTKFTVTEASEPNGVGKGTGTLAGKRFTYLSVSSKQCGLRPSCPYLQGQSFWQEYYRGYPELQTMAKGFEGKWTLTHGDNNVVNALQDLRLVGGLLHCDACTFEKGGTRTIDGQQATQLTSGDNTFWVTQGNPDRLVAFGAHPSAVTGWHGSPLDNVDITIASAKLPKVTVPAEGQRVDPKDVSTLPAEYDAMGATADENSCDRKSCVMQADIQNRGGAPQGTSTVQITAQDPTTKKNIASCAANIPAIPSLRLQTVSCTITGAAWTAWADNPANSSAGGFFYLAGTAEITANPPYLD